ncbi:MAG TPA: FixH family protein, partial [Saprospiraceae bacterium]|nr:FixH family protein [Saprospiraceae bacterium]
AGVVFAKAYEEKKKAGEYSVELTMEKSAFLGKNDLEIVVKDAAGQYVTDAKVIANYSMPAMSGSPAMNYNAVAQLHGNIYHATLDIPMAGSWNLTIKISHKGKTISARFTIDAN